MNRSSLPALGTPLSSAAVKVMMLSAGELGKEVIIALPRFGVEVIAVDQAAACLNLCATESNRTIDRIDARNSEVGRPQGAVYNAALRAHH